MDGLAILKVVLLLLLLGSLAIWLGSLIRLIKNNSSPMLTLDHDIQPGDDESPLVSVILPAKDEAHNIRQTLRMLLDQQYPNLEIVVVDDRSSDGTAAIVQEMAADDPRLRLHQVKALPEGWFGKTHALHVGVGLSRGQYMLFTDADCRHHPGSIASGLAFLRKHGGDMVTLTPDFQTITLMEKIIQPAVSTNFGVWFIFGGRDPLQAKRPFANGQYMLMSRTAYCRAGGMEAVRNKISEDISFARNARQAGLKVLVGLGAKLFSTRMYDSLPTMWKGWTRIYYGSFERAHWLALVWLRTFIVAFLPFPAMLASAAALLLGAGGPWPIVMASTSLLGMTVIILTSRRSYPLMGLPAKYAVFYPLGVLGALCFQIGAISRALGLSSVTWRGTRYRNGRLVKGESCPTS